MTAKNETETCEIWPDTWLLKVQLSPLLLNGLPCGLSTD